MVLGIGIQSFSSMLLFCLSVNDSAQWAKKHRNKILLLLFLHHNEHWIIIIFGWVKQIIEIGAFRWFGIIEWNLILKINNNNVNDNHQQQHQRPIAFHYHSMDTNHQVFFSSSKRQFDSFQFNSIHFWIGIALFFLIHNFFPSSYHHHHPLQSFFNPSITKYGFNRF